MKSILSILIFISTYSICNSQDYNFFNQDTLEIRFSEADSSRFIVKNLNTEKYGILFASGEEMIPYKYEYLGRIKEGLRMAITDSKYGFLNESGELVIDHMYYGGNNFSNGRAVMFNKNGFGVIDKNNKVIIPFEYASLLTSDHSFYSFKKKGGKVGIMDFNEKTKVEPIYDNISLKNDSIWICSKERKLEIYKYNGDKHLNEVINSMGRASYSGYITVIVDNRKGMLDEHFNWILKPEHKYLKSLFTNYIGIQDSLGWKVYDKNKIQVIDEVYQEIYFLDKSHCIVKFKGKNKIIDLYGENIFNHETENIRKIDGDNTLLLIDEYLYDGFSFNKIIQEPVSLVSNFPRVKDGMLAIKVDGKCAVIDTSGNYIISPKYNHCEDKLSIGYLKVQGIKTHKWGLLNLDNQLIVPVEYDYVEHSGGIGQKARFWLEKNNSKSFFADQEIIVSNIDSLVNFLGDYIFFKKKGKLGFINTYKSTFKMLDYDSVIVDNIPFIVIEEGKYGTLDLEGNLDIPLEYNFLEAAGSFLISKKGNKYGTISLENKILEKPRFDKIEKGLLTMFGKAHLDGKIGLLNSDGYLLLPVEYDSLDVKVNGQVFAKKDNKNMQFNCLELQLKTLE